MLQCPRGRGQTIRVTEMPGGIDLMFDNCTMIPGVLLSGGDQLLIAARGLRGVVGWCPNVFEQGAGLAITGGVPEVGIG